MPKQMTAIEPMLAVLTDERCLAERRSGEVDRARAPASA